MLRLLLTSAILLVAVGWAAAPADSDPQPPLYAQAPEKFQKLQNPLEGDSDAVEVGRRLFERACAKCHSAEDSATKGPKLEGEQIRNASPGGIFWVIKTGNTSRGMPGFSQFPDKQKWQIVTYIRSLRVEEKR